MGDVGAASTDRWARIRAARWFAPVVIGWLLLASVIAIAWELPFANRTEEDNYMPLALDDVVHGRNPYATWHFYDHKFEGAWTSIHDGFWSPFVYLPVLAILQLPLVDYRFTALAAYAALLWALRDRPPAFLAFGNPFVAHLASSGYNDFVPLALLAWSLRVRIRALTWLALGAKQLALPMLLVWHAMRRDARGALEALAATALFTIPFLVWDAQSFWDSAVTKHLTGSGEKFSPFLQLGHQNYWLWVLFFLFVLWPVARPTTQRAVHAVPTTALSPKEA